MGYIYIDPPRKVPSQVSENVQPQDTDISGAMNVASNIFYKQLKVSLLNQILEVFEIYTKLTKAQ